MHYEESEDQESQQDGSKDYQELILGMLKDYDHIEDDDIEVCQPNENPFTWVAQTQTYMHNTHRTLVPIGANFQVFLPPVLTPEAYRAKSAEMMRALAALKVNDPEQGEAFYQQHFAKIQVKFGPGRTYEDVNELRLAFARMNSSVSFQAYMHKYAKHWETHFKNKDRNTGPKLPAKKKKKKGTIPT